MKSNVGIADLQSLAGERVRVRLGDTHDFVGTLRTELLTDRSVSVYIEHGDGDGATLYIDQITGIWPER